MTQSLERYQNDPVLFCTEVLGELITDDVKKMMYSVRDHQVTIAVSANSVGKTHGAARVAIWFYKCFEEAQVYTAAAPPIDNLKTLLWGEIGRVVRNKPELFSNDSYTSLRLADHETTPTKFIVGRTIPTSGTPEDREAKFSGKHSKNLLFIFDEGDAIPDEVYKGADSCMSGGNSKMLIMFNPKKKTGAVYSMIQEGRGNVVHLSAFNHPNVRTGKNIIPGAVDRNTTVRRIMDWSVPTDTLAGSDTFEVPEFLVGSTCVGLDGRQYPPLEAGVRRGTEPQLFYMVLGRYPPQAENQLIDENWISAAVERWKQYTQERGLTPPPGYFGPKLGFDVAALGNDWNKLCFRYGPFVAKFEGWRGLDPDLSARKVREFALKEQASCVNVDAIGVGVSVAPWLSRHGINAHSVEVSRSPTKDSELGRFNKLRDQLLWEVREWLKNDPDAMLPPDQDLLEELRVATYQVKEDKIWVMSSNQFRELLKRSPDSLMSLALTFYEAELSKLRSTLI